MCVYRRRFSVTIWLVWLWRLASLETQEPVVQMKTEVSPLENPTLPREAFLFCLAFNWLHEAHPYYGVLPAVFRVYQFKYYSHPKHPPGWHLKLTLQWGSEFTYWSGFDFPKCWFPPGVSNRTNANLLSKPSKNSSGRSS